ncbi:2-dehydro-3-deoxygalactonokinase [Ramlibacter sp. USB13]|uniref:2-dehydro-3-deoxygalactonokinase n=1 Tax=Ramlibacter cellulosilyticus TaxID=2764187 RepID=A0A923MV55_9BURK|nr:2-dehydro-3-deoxygalactonokinase [Ramlibacter cellulosilyticus]MBC5784327.1 2-dehydro-3-deoxygalactonokinase [Ramlibacter cellulosilyticus]
MLIAVDWGTSSLRAARIAADGTVLEQRASQRGILTVPAGGFPGVLHEACGDWLEDPAALCLVSGMAGSRQGWVEAPYCPCPAGFGELAQALLWVEPRRIALVPGLSCEADGVPDVMRGEEVQVFGAMALLGAQHGTFVLPGTHSKWVRVDAGRVQSFATCMSGEFYALLRQHSILARTLPQDDGALDEAAFVRGVQHAQRSGSLLHAAFSARTLSLFDRLDTPVAPSYLSGLVIGEELRLQARDAGDVVLVGSPQLTRRYAIALAALGRGSRALGAEATWRGLWALARSLESA